MARDLLRLLDTLALDAVCFCGLSMGGMVGLWLGAHAPARLHKLVVSNTAAKIGTADGWNDRIAAVERGGMAAVVPAVLERWYTPHFRASHPEEIERTQQMLLGTPVAGYAASCAAVRDMDQRDDLSRIAAPTLVVYGTQDAVTPPDAAHLLTERIPSAQSLALAAAHLSNVEQPVEFTTGVLRFLLD